MNANALHKLLGLGLAGVMTLVMLAAIDALSFTDTVAAEMARAPAMQPGTLACTFDAVAPGRV